MLVEDSHSRVMHGSLRLLLTYCTSWSSASKLTTAGFAKWARFKKLSGSTQISVLEDITFNVHFRRESKSAQSNIKLCELKSAYGFYTLAAVEWASCPSICQTGLRHPYRRRISQEYRKNREWFTIHRHIDGFHNYDITQAAQSYLDRLSRREIRFQDFRVHVYKAFFVFLITVFWIAFRKTTLHPWHNACTKRPIFWARFLSFGGTAASVAIKLNTGRLVRWLKIFRTFRECSSPMSWLIQIHSTNGGCSVLTRDHMHSLVVCDKALLDVAMRSSEVHHSSG